MVTIGMNYKVLFGKEEIFERAYGKVLDVIKQSQGHTRSCLYQDVHARGSYLILSQWNDQNAFDAFVKSESFAKVTAWGKEQILSEKPRHQVYKE